MTKLQRSLACLLALILAFGTSLTALAEDRPTAWDLTEFYTDDAAVEADFSEIEGMLAKLSALRGTLNTAEGVIAWYDLDNELELRFGKPAFYCSMRTCLSDADQDAAALNDRANELIDRLDVEAAAMEAELLSQSEELLDSLETDERMAPYLRPFQVLRSTAAHRLTEEQETLLAPLTTLTENAQELYTELVKELPYQELVFPDGVTRTADSGNYDLVLSADCPQAFRKEYNAAMLSAYAAFRGTFAQNYSSYLTGKSELAKAHGYASMLEEALINGDVAPELYQAAMDASLSSSDLVERYTKLLKQELGLETLYGADTNLVCAPLPEKTYTYDEACELVLAALAPLGETYAADARMALDSGWVDVYPAEGKYNRTVVFDVPNIHPYILLNFDGTLNSVAALANELGQVMNQFYSAKAHPAAYTSHPTAAISEVSGYLCELLLYEHLIENAATDDEKKGYLAQEMDQFYVIFYTQAEYAHFQQISIEALENGEALTADTLEQLWLENTEKYNGNGAVAMTDYTVAGWLTYSNFYSDLSTYRYPILFAAVCDIAQRIGAGAEGAVDSYLAFLAMGDTASVGETYAVAGVNTTDGTFADALLTRFGALMDEYEALAK